MPVVMSTMKRKDKEARFAQVYYITDGIMGAPGSAANINHPVANDC